jgi:cardiolipin synthase
MDLVRSTHFQPEVVVSDGQLYFDSIVADIGLAKSRIDLEVYIFSDDIAGRRVAKALILAARRGVQVRILVDGVGSKWWGGELADLLREAGVQVRVFHPLPWHFWKLTDEFGTRTWIWKIFFLWAKINRRNHRKTLIIDSKKAWVGSFNVSASHLPVSIGGGGWRDSAVCVVDQRVFDLQLVFEKTWTQDWVRKLKLPAFKFPRLVRLNQSRWQRTRSYRDLLMRVMFCRDRIWITSAYFIPEFKILQRLIKAARSGVEVRILLPKQSDVRFMTWSAKSFYHQLLEAGVQIFEYYPSVLHAKVVVLDDWVTVGSSNLNHRSILKDLEVDLVVLDDSSRREVMNQFAKDLMSSDRIEKENMIGSSFYIFLGRIILLLRTFL